MPSLRHHHYQSSLRHSFASALLLIIVLSTLCSARPKKDVLHFANGDRLTCEIIKLEKGYLYVKLEYADGTVAMDWSKIVSVESPQSFVVADQAGKRYTGTLQNASVEKTPPEEELKVEIAGSSASQVISGKEVVEIERTDTSFWQNLHGSLNAGLNYSKQQNRTQYNFRRMHFFKGRSGRWARTINPVSAEAVISRTFATTSNLTSHDSCDPPATSTWGWQNSCKAVNSNLICARPSAQPWGMFSVTRTIL